MRNVNGIKRSIQIIKVLNRNIPRKIFTINLLPYHNLIQKLNIIHSFILINIIFYLDN